jgi:hypothetical protein
MNKNKVLNIRKRCAAAVLGMAALGMALIPSAGFASSSCGGESTGTVVSTSQTNAEAARTVVSVVSSRISTMLMPTAAGRTGAQISSLGDNAQSGQAAGDAGQGFGLWGSGSVSFMHDSAQTTKHNGDLTNVLAGIDYRVTDKLVAGMAIGYEYLGLDTRYNSGKMTTKGLTFTPYVGYTIMENLNVDAMLGYSFLTTNMRDGAVNTYKADYSSNRMMAALNVNYRIPTSYFDTIVSGGYMYSNERSETYDAKALGQVDINVRSRDAFIGELRGGARVERVFADRFTPYLGAYYLYDTTLSSSVRTKDFDAVEFVGGMDARVTDKLRLGLELSDTCFRRYEDNARVGLNLRYEW